MAKHMIFNSKKDDLRHLSGQICTMLEPLNVEDTQSSIQLFKVRFANGDVNFAFREELTSVHTASCAVTPKNGIFTVGKLYDCIMADDGKFTVPDDIGEVYCFNLSNRYFKFLKY